jgi:succinate-semialdehyde dehydrogenase / glutarate-semialdehyde dehydrogenase
MDLVPLKRWMRANEVAGTNVSVYYNMLRSIHPFDQSLVAEFPLMSAREVQQKLDKSAVAFKSWRKTTFEERARLMKRAGEILRLRKGTYAGLITQEMGKVLPEAQAEVEKCAAGCDYFAQKAPEFLADTIITTEAGKSFVTYNPTGTILAIMPWNFPFWQVFRFAMPALMAGNVGVLKHAPNVTQCALAIEEIFREAGFPDGVFQTLLADVDQVEAIIQHPAVQGVALTGSEYAGSSVAAIAGRNIKKTVLELGGSDPFIVLEDADLAATIKVAVQSRMQNAGQSCISAKRFIVVDKIRDEFIVQFQHGIEALRQGNPFKEGITTGPLARIDLAEKLEKQLQTSLTAGATLLAGGTRSGCNFQPTLIAGVKPGMPAYEEETFGPLAAVIAVRNEAEALEVANASRYGLGASVWTRDRDRGEHLARQIESGSVFINSLMRSDVRLPFGGIKKSGYGRELSELGIKEFVNVKTVFVG